jgi:septal ring factor EnvC (AmiA/AmiB activator)
MDDFTTREILFGLLGSGGVLITLLKVAKSISDRIDARRKRIDANQASQISQTAELKRLKIDADEDIYDRFKELLTEREKEIKELKAELKKCQDAPTNQKLIDEMYRTLRIILNEIDAMNMLFLNERDTQIFARRFKAMHDAAKEMRDKLP